MKTAKQMFGKLAQEMRESAERELEALAARQHAADEAEARLDAPISRREVLNAIESVASEYAGSGFPKQEIICDAFRKLAGALS